jgi:diguanylate cyclase (GGDEF)-like protein
VPVELLFAVLLLSVVANATLLFWLSRSDRVRFRWPRLLGDSFDSSRGRPPAADPPLPRRRSLFVAESPTRRAPVETGTIPFSAAFSPPISRAPLSKALPTDLADLLARPATIAAGAEGAGFAPVDADQPKGNGRRATDGEVGIVARLPRQSNAVSQEMTIDALTGLEGPASWSRIIEIENARLLRYRRPVTVVMVEVEGLRRLAERLGDDPVDRLLPVIADALRREARATDWVARIGDGRFAAFLPETDEIQAINYVERIRLVCEPWLASSAVPLWLAIGWSGPTASSDLEFALLRAEERMHADRRMPGRSIQLPRVVPGRVVSVSRPGQTDPGDAEEPLVPPAETGRSGEWIGSAPRSEGPSGADSSEPSRAGGHRNPTQTGAGAERRKEV